MGAAYSRLKSRVCAAPLINRIWMPRQPEIVLSVTERQDALAITNEILRELEAEEQQCGR